MISSVINNVLNIDSGIVTNFKLCFPSDILSHELVVEDRFNSLKNYIETLKPYIIIPTILACDKTSVIIDGHHRFQSLIALGINQIPVTFINYNKTAIVPDLANKITKEEIINAGISGNLLKPKSSFHHVISSDGKYYLLCFL